MINELSISNETISAEELFERVTNNKNKKGEIENVCLVNCVVFDTEKAQKKHKTKYLFRLQKTKEEFLGYPIKGWFINNNIFCANGKEEYEFRRITEKGV